MDELKPKWDVIINDLDELVKKGYVEVVRDKKSNILLGINILDQKGMDQYYEQKSAQIKKEV